MKAAVQKWVVKAEADYAAALLLRRSRKRGTRDLVCFHLQQCLEKYLKARLVDAAIAFPRTHDLERLLDLILPVEPTWAVMRSALASVTDYAVEARYPGSPISSAEALTALRAARRARDTFRRSLGLH